MNENGGHRTDSHDLIVVAVSQHVQGIWFEHMTIECMHHVGIAVDGSPIRRAGWAGLARNMCVALGNWGSPEAVPVLTAALGSGAAGVGARRLGARKSGFR